MRKSNILCFNSSSLWANLKVLSLPKAAATPASIPVTISETPIEPTPTAPLKKKRPAKKYKETKFAATRLIALKFAYLGANYNGFEYHLGNTTPLPTVEEEVFKALLKARLVPGKDGRDDLLGWPGDEVAEYSKCGRTDKGVSGFGQVIGVRVRSNRPKGIKEDGTYEEGLDETTAPKWDPIDDEVQYINILNRLLPDDIRMLAWCPNPPPGFSARFNCRNRQYKYFFTNPFLPAFPSISSSAGTRAITLDIGAMAEAARLYEGEHDFRNFCKVDASKQITNFERRMLHSSITECSTAPPNFFPLPTAPMFTPATATGSIEAPKLYTFNLHGTAFLWHQVRHMIAILFLIGQGLEKPEVITQLFDIDANPGKPQYEMADDKPLVLWDCDFRDDEIEWVYPTVDLLDPVKAARVSIDRRRDHYLIDKLWENWHQRKLEETLAGKLLEITLADVHKRNKCADIEDSDSEMVEVEDGHSKKRKRDKLSVMTMTGTSKPGYRGTYVPVMERERNDNVEVINKRYTDKKGEEYWKSKKDRKEAYDSKMEL